MNSIINRVVEVLKTERIFLRPSGSPGLWVAFLVPVTVVYGCLKSHNTSLLYRLSAVYSFNIILNVLHLLFHIFWYKSISVTKSFNLQCAIPATISLFLYTQISNLDVKKGLCYTVANALIYFEGLPFLLKAFPKTFSFGEANIAVQAFSLLIFNLFVELNKILLEGLPPNEYDTSTIILLLSLSWVLVYCVLPYISSSFQGVLPMYMLGFFVAGMIYISIEYFLNCNFFLWIWLFLTKPERIGIVSLWFVCATLAFIVVFYHINSGRQSSTIVRKYFHILIVIVFLSGVFLDSALLYFSSGCVLGLFIILEVFRIIKLPPLYFFLQSGFLIYSDEKDSGVLALTPICLLCGIAFPLWCHPSKSYFGDLQLCLLSGVFTVGVGDTFASIGGKILGKHHWKNSQKTYEGTICYIISQVIFLCLLLFCNILQLSADGINRGLIGILITAIIEAKTDQIDNIVLPLVMYICTV